jgi:hypothetical protein
MMHFMNKYSSKIYFSFIQVSSENNLWFQKTYRQAESFWESESDSYK